MSTAEYYTPAWLASIAQRVMDGIDLDPASCALANATVMADMIFDSEDDGLSEEWAIHARKIFINPPGQCGDDFPKCGNKGACSCDLPRRFWAKAVECFSQRPNEVQIFWVGFNLGQIRMLQSERIHPLSKPVITCITKSRVKFSSCASPKYDNFVSLLSSNPVSRAAFAEKMAEHGAIINAP